MMRTGARLQVSVAGLWSASSVLARPAAAAAATATAATTATATTPGAASRRALQRHPIHRSVLVKEGLQEGWWRAADRPWRSHWKKAESQWRQVMQYNTVLLSYTLSCYGYGYGCILGPRPVPPIYATPRW